MKTLKSEMAVYLGLFFPENSVVLVFKADILTGYRLVEYL